MSDTKFTGLDLGKFQEETKRRGDGWSEASRLDPATAEALGVEIPGDDVHRAMAVAAPGFVEIEIPNAHDETDEGEGPGDVDDAEG